MWGESHKTGQDTGEGVERIKTFKSRGKATQSDDSYGRGRVFCLTFHTGAQFPCLPGRKENPAWLWHLEGWVAFSWFSLKQTDLHSDCSMSGWNTAGSVNEPPSMFSLVLHNFLPAKEVKSTGAHSAQHVQLLFRHETVSLGLFQGSSSTTTTWSRRGRDTTRQ